MVIPIGKQFFRIDFMTPSLDEIAKSCDRSLHRGALASALLHRLRTDVVGTRSGQAQYGSEEGVESNP